MDGINIQSRQNAHPFKVAHFSEKTKTTEIIVREMLFTDDSALISHSAEEIPKIVDTYSNASNKSSLKINIVNLQKTEVLYQLNSTKTQELDITVDGNKLNTVQEFSCVGSIISSDGYINAEIQRRMSKASTSFGRL